MERRRFRRPRLSLNVQACSNDHAVGHVLNLTDEGVCLTGRGAPPAEPFPLKFELPLPVYGQREIHVLAEPRWHDYLSNGHWQGDTATADLGCSTGSQISEKPVAGRPAWLTCLCPHSF